jgi:ABC-2 type transport system ATP-binding protein
VLAKVGLTERRNNSFKTYSLGMKQRLALAAALVSDPEVLVLDEPTNGMDPQGIADIRNLILDVAAEGTTILLASHLLDEVQKICSHVSVLEKGQKIFDGPVEKILEGDEQIEIWAEDSELLLQLLNEFKGIENLSKEHDKYIIKLSAGPTKKDLHKYLIEKNVYPTHFVARSGTLESKFLELLNQRK